MPTALLLRRMPHALLLSLALGPAAAHAAGSYPDRPITLVVPFAAGGGADVVARLLATKLPSQLGGQSVIVDNKPGASGNIGATQVSRAPADGYTFLLTNSTLTINASLDMRGTPDVRKALAPVSLLVIAPVALGVNAAVPAKTVPELIDYVGQNAGKLSYSSCGNGTPQHFTGESIKQAAKLDMVHVPYKGCAPAVNDGLGNQVPILFSTIPNLAPHAESGKLRMLAVASAKRVSFMPDLPAIAETKPFGALDISVWFGVLAPKGLPADVKEKFEAAITATMADPAVQKEFRDRYYEIEKTGAAAMSSQIDKDLDMYGKLAEQSGITLE
ncbi:tripartite tricarboxylate transporter substrate binding protein [Bordetella sp. BOR01]|uniref:tripartite tricarboxylate transporter substrate binding protein n=1 Tax=Bordetella sp. BOR01 TaxID=2854779 RepID=UPI001C466A7A|nr:tripartite tricarboxylate transporter substrate binding protein [Bordetella sp. BOR01]MBV7483805.1 tripartite tricarboxylate transporter substrate binding protein [Bordetella sp. BOR01]